MKRRILVVEDDRAFSQVLTHHLASRGFEVREVANGEKALGMATAFAPDLVLLDVTLPGKSGLELCAAWARSKHFPVIMMTCLDGRRDELRGFHVGADDYVTKPFDLETLVARINAVLRRARPTLDCVSLGPITLDFINLTASDGEHRIEFTHREFQILRYLAERANTIVSREELLREVWEYQAEPRTRSVDMAMTRLRRKLEADPHHPVYLHSARGGYLLSLTTQT